MAIYGHSEQKLVQQNPIYDRSDCKNIIFESLDADSRRRLERHVQTMKAKLGDVIAEAHEPFEYVYFPKSAILTLSTVLERGSAIETGNIGNEGLFGFAGIYSKITYCHCHVLLEGTIFRIPVEVLREEFERSETLRRVLMNYLSMRLAQMQQTLACNTVHTVYERLCRWLLIMPDCAESEHLPFTHETLSHALGVDRKSVTLAAQGLQMAGLISYSRGKIQIQDRPGLESSVCECYGVINELRQQFFALYSKQAPRRLTSPICT
ncbi:MAG: Crp/Fnr family transcriptional regulator [Methylocella sp.]